MNSVYLYLMAWVTICAILVLGKGSRQLVNGNRMMSEYRYPWFWAIVIILPLIIEAGKCFTVGDTYLYIDMFNDYPSNLSHLKDYIEEGTKDQGFIYLGTFIKQFISSDQRIYLTILAGISGLCLMIPYKKYSCNYAFSIFLFLISTDYVSWMLNGRRQFLVAAILFAFGAVWIPKRKYISLIIVILLMSTIHASVLLYIPIIFIVNGEAFNKKTLFFMVSILVSITLLYQFTGLLDELLKDTNYRNVVGQFAEDDGTNILRVMVYSVPTVIALVWRKTLKKHATPIINLCVNMSMISSGFYIISMFTSGIFIGRVPIYFSLYNYILLPWEIYYLFTADSKKRIYILAIACYAVFYYVQMFLAW